jgi:hypothetical protein
MAAGIQPVRVEGLAEFQRALKAMDDKLPRELSKANKAAAEMVATKARAKASAQGGVAAKAAPNIKAAAEQRRSKITIGGPKAPYGLGAEFGGQGRPSTMQFKPHRGREGYALYPTIRDTETEFMELYGKALDELTRRAFPD